MTTVLRLETMAYNRLLNLIRTDLSRLEAALQGHIVMSVEVEAAYEDVQKGKLPSTWDTFSYPTESMLNGYLEVQTSMFMFNIAAILTNTLYQCANLPLLQILDIYKFRQYLYRIWLIVLRSSTRGSRAEVVKDALHQISG